MSPRDATCKICDGPIFWAAMPNGHMLPLDPDTSPAGTVAVSQVIEINSHGEEEPSWEGRHLHGGDECIDGEYRFVSHKLTCPGRSRRR